MLVLLISFSIFVLAIISLPHIFSGTVEYSEDSEMILTGYDISASIGSYGLGVVGEVGANNEYGIAIDPQGRTGEITFYIGGAEASPPHEYEWGGESLGFDLIINDEPNETIRCGNGFQEPGEQCDDLDLGTGTCENVLGIPEATGTLSCTDICTFDYSNCTAPYCGDSSCNNDETCSSCPIDCGACSSYDDDDGGSGGSGSSSSSTTSTTSKDGQIIITAIDETGDEEGETIGIGENQPTDPGITGGVIGFVKLRVGIGLIIVSLLFIVRIGVVTLRKKKSSVKKEVEE